MQFLIDLVQSAVFDRFVFALEEVINSILFGLLGF